MVERMRVPCTTSPASNADVRAPRSKPASRDHNPMHIEGVYGSDPAMASSVSAIVPMLFGQARQSTAAAVVPQ